MGAKAAANLPVRVIKYKCDICGKILMSMDGLKSHKLHNAACKTKSKLKTRPVNNIRMRLQAQKLKNEKQVKTYVRPNVKQSVSNKTVNITVKEAVKKPPMKATLKKESKAKQDTTVREYDCPKCSKTFRIFFSAHKHIQHYHCVNKFDEKVSPNSSQLIKPILRKVCTKCNKKLNLYDSHSCKTQEVKNDDIGILVNYVCSGCHQHFHNLRLFDVHVAGLHCSNVESMFFPSKEVFQTWKTEMEEQTKAQYSILGLYTSKKMYHCTSVPDVNSSSGDTAYPLCPSTIVVQELGKGTQVLYYKEHYGHNCCAYVSSDKYSQPKIASANIEKEDSELNVNDLHLQFKQLLECILLDAAKMDVETLKVLIGKALDMTSVLNNTEDDPDSDTVETKHIIENSVTRDSGGEKRKIDKNTNKSKTEAITKRFTTRSYQFQPNSNSPNVSSVSLQQESDEIKITNSYSLADKDIIKVVREIDKEYESDKLENRRNKQEVTAENDVEDMAQSPISLTDSSKKKRQMKADGKMVKESHKFKSKIKEGKLLGPRFKNKEPSAMRLRPKPVDYKYEVKERENDCNILILKI